MSETTKGVTSHRSLLTPDAITNERPRTREPIALTGIGCRFPGARGPEAFWRLLVDGVDAITEVPANRFDIDAVYDPRPGIPGKINTRWGGFLDAIDQFDPYFFGISAREAAAMDPQHRLLLEVAWEALEDAGEVPERLLGAPVGVFIGMCNADYSNLLNDFDDIDIYMAAGNARSIVSGRLSYALGFQGPSVVVDTACSSSLVAVHLACQSLWSGESSLALAGGVNLVLLAAASVGFCRAQMLSPDGRCKAFDARANGFVRSDGVGVVVLKPLSKARADGDPIYAVIRGGAINNDGQSGGYLMTPSRPGQEAVLREAYRNAGVSPADVQYVETHGTGTSAGDPVEALALGDVLATDRPADRPCIIGSVKTNIGHTEGASGVAGLIKVALALKHRSIPGNLHLQEPNPVIPWKDLPLVVSRELTPWPSSSRPTLAGVSSFGISGTNVHLILEEAPRPSGASSRGQESMGNAHLLTLSAHSREALEAVALAHAAFLRKTDGAGTTTEDVCYTASARRAHHDHRVALVGRTHGELADHLDAFIAGELRPGLSSGRRIQGRERKLVFVFPGQGSQWIGMARDLIESEPAFRKTLEACAQALRSHADWSLLDELRADETHSRLDELDVIQPTLFAIQVALAALWRSWGIIPDAVVGHSMGEVAAAHVAGILSLEDAARIISRRSQVVRRRASGKGGMAVVELPADEVKDLLSPLGDRLTIAACNGPTTTVVAGEPAALDELGASLQRRGTFFQKVKVDYASHSHQMEPLRAELLEVLGEIRPQRASIDMLSTVSGKILEGPEADASYWVRNIREPVLFAQAVDRLAEDGHDIFVEVSPHPAITSAISQCLRRRGSEGLVLASLRRGEDGRACMLGTLGALHVEGESLDWSRLYPAGGRCVTLPFYPWQRERFWLEVPEGSTGQSGGTRPGGKGHRLLGEPLSLAAQAGTHFWQTQLGVRHLGYLADHRVQGLIVLPAAAYVEMALAAAEQAAGPGSHALENLSLKKALFLPEEGSRTVQITLAPGLRGETGFQLFSRDEGSRDGRPSWTLHATGTIRFGQAGSAAAPPEHETPESIRARCPDSMGSDELYRKMQDRGLQYGPSFQGVEEIWGGEGEAVGRLRAPQAVEIESSHYHVHPALLDASFQVLAGALRKDEASESDIFLPVALEKVRLHARPAGALWSHAVLRKSDGGSEDTRKGDVYLLDHDGRVVLEALGFVLQRVGGGATGGRAQDLRSWLYELTWQPKARADAGPAKLAPKSDASASWLLFADDGGIADGLRAMLEARDESCVVVVPGETYARLETSRYQIDPLRLEDFHRLLADTLGPDRPPCRGIAHFWSLDVASPADTTLPSLQAAKELGCVSVLHLVQALAGLGRPGLPQLWLVTGGAQPAGETTTSVSVAQAPLSGLGKVIAIEHPELRPRMVDLSARPESMEIRALFDEIASPDPEDHIALRGETRYVQRLVRFSPETREDTKRPLEAGESFALEIPTPGILDNLVLRAKARVAPGPGEVEIQVTTVGLNFRDVMIAMGLVPAVYEVDFGWECAGRISALGDGVAGLEVGQEVFALAPSCVKAFAITEASLVVPKPERLSAEEAVTIPIAFITAYHALRHMARLRKGERVLIHAAAGGVGLAAVQVAQQVGAEVFATAGSPEKREFLRSRGIEHVMDSRSLDFADEVLRITGGKGVDVVLNSLAGDFIHKSLSTLGLGGRYLEIGKVDILQNRPLGLRELQKNISFIVVDLSQMIFEERGLFVSLLREVVDLFESGALSPLPVRAFPVAELADALRHLAQAKHIGKVAISIDAKDLLVAPARQERVTFRSDGTYLITGGLGGLGLVTARWMVERGARHLALTGRSGASSAAAKEAVDAMEQAGARVMAIQADVADREQMARVLDDVGRAMPPLRGVIHAAVALDDGILLTQNSRRFQSVMAAKIDGTWNLHTLTLGTPLDFFVLFSSAASVLGSPGQGNYVAASMFQDALAHHRRALGLPALTINWGAWGEVGLAARPEATAVWMKQGLAHMSPGQGLELFERMLASGAAQLTAVRVDWSKLTSSHAPPLLEALALEVAKPAGAAKGKRRKDGLTKEKLQAAAPGDAQKLVETFLLEQISRVLKCSPSKVDLYQPINKLGIDSLMAVELKNRIEMDLEAAVPVAVLLKGPTLAQLAAALLEQLGGAGGASAAPPITPEDTPERMLAKVDQLSDREVERLLAEVAEGELGGATGRGRPHDG